MIIILKFILIILIILIIFFFKKNIKNYIKNILIKNDYWYRICFSSIKKDYYKWILSDKYIAKKYVIKYLGFYIPKTYQLVKNPEDINFNKLKLNYVIKPTDLCDSVGVYLIKNNINQINGKKVNPKKIIKELNNLRKTVDEKYYMYFRMYNGKIPFKGYIIEELLLDNEKIPSDYKCYTFGGKIYFIAITYDRKKINNKTTYKTVWMTRDWKGIFIFQ